MKMLLTVLLACCILAGCERNIDFKLNEAAPKLVVEGTIENGTAPVVYLSQSQQFFSKVDLSVLASSFVHDAEVFISNGVLTHQLKEYTVQAAPGINFYYYSIDSSNLSTAFIGELNKQYSLRVKWKDKEYTATTKIPFITKRIDSMYWKAASGDADTNKVRVMLKVTDPPVLGDYDRYFTRQNSEPFYPGFASVHDDQIIDGTTYEIPIDRSVPRFQDLPDFWYLFDKGDTVTLKLSNIDKATYDFWRTMEFSYGNAGNPFSSPIKVLSNMSAGALGYFGGYASQYKTIIIPR